MTLREARKRRGLSQKDLAGIVGISPTALSFIENYKAFPRAVTRKRLQKIFYNQIEFYPASVLLGMIDRYLGNDPKLVLLRAESLKEYVNSRVECTILNIRNYKTIKR